MYAYVGASVTLTEFDMFKEKDRIKTPKGAGTIVKLRKSSYSNSILFYVIKLDSGEEYLCPVDLVEELVK